MSTSCERSECVSVACINILLDCLAFLFLELLLFCFLYRNSVRGLTQPSFLQFHRSMTVSVSRPPSAARRAFKEKWEPWAYGTVRHKLPGRGYRKRRNFVGIRKKHYDTERKQAPVKLVLTAGCGRGIAARRMFNVGDDVVEYGGCLVKTGLNLNSARGVSEAGLELGASYLLQLASPEGEAVQQWRLGGFRKDAENGLLGSFANDPFGRVCPITNTALTPNVRYEMQFGADGVGIPWLVCIRPIAKGDEILVDYGWSKAVWRAHLATEAASKLSCFDDVILCTEIDTEAKLSCAV